MTEPMRVALVVHGWPPETVGGTGLYVSVLAKSLSKHGHRTCVVFPQPTETQVPLQDENRAFEVIPISVPSPRRWEETWSQQNVEAQWTTWLNDWRPDVVHFHHLAGLSLHLPDLAREHGCRVIITLHDYAIPCLRGQLVDPSLNRCEGPEPSTCAQCAGAQLRLNPVTQWVGATLSYLPRLRNKIRKHASPTQPNAAHQALTRARIDAAKSALDSAHMLLSPSKDLSDRFDRLKLGRPEVHALPVLDDQWLRPARRPEYDGPTRFLFASSMIPTKGAHLVLNAFQSLPKTGATLTLAGPSYPFDGYPNYAANLHQRAASTPNVHWLGAVPHADMTNVMVRHDVLVLPSLWPENSPIVVREAVASGLRIVLSENTGAGELAPDAVTVALSDPKHLRLAMMHEANQGPAASMPASNQWISADQHCEWLISKIYKPSQCHSFR